MSRRRASPGVVIIAVLFALRRPCATAQFGESARHGAPARARDWRCCGWGQQYRSALESHYYRASPGPVKHLPVSLDELVRDLRFPEPGAPPAQALPPTRCNPRCPGPVKRGSQIIGVYSRSDAAPLRRHRFTPGLGRASKAPRSTLAWRSSSRVPRRRPRPLPRPPPLPSRLSHPRCRRPSAAARTVSRHCSPRSPTTSWSTEAVDGRETVAKTLHRQPDLVVMDLSLQASPGIDATAQIRRRLPQQKVLALSDSTPRSMSARTTRAGCIGCVRSDCARKMLLAVENGC